ncbi:MAG: DUF4123 domain-containing protein [Acidobacteria bacterium]|nr:DUF4123 domain-containing protein [Acidobacteriota bacterium]
MIEQKLLPAPQLASLASSGRLFAIVDACGNPAVLPRVNANPGQAICLAESRVREQAPDAVPFLFRVDAGILDWVKGFWTEPWGIFVATEIDPMSLYSHLANFLVVELPGNKKRAFRYYDPRLLKAFLQSCTPDQLRTFFGPIRGFGVPSGDEVQFLVEDTRATANAVSKLATPSGLFPIFAPQIEKLQKATDENLRGIAIEHLQSEHPALVKDITKEALIARVDAAIAAARNYKLTERGTILAFVTLSFDAGAKFHSHPKIQPLLADMGKPGKVRMQLVLTRVPDNVWSQLRLAAGRGA